MIRVEVSGRGHRLKFETDDPDEAARRAALFIKDYYPEVYKRLFRGCSGEVE